MLKSLLHSIISMFIIIFLVAGSFFIVTSSLYLYLSPKLPSVESLKTVKLQTPLRIYSQDAQLIGEFGEKKRTPLKIEQIPKQYIQALLSAEDDRFYNHMGIDIPSLFRAAFQLITTGRIKTGGSTITMQVARNFFLTRAQSFTRKFNEILLAFRIEDELTKDEILELYANKIYQGHRAYGIEAAAHVYYGKTVSELSLAQVAMLAGLPKAPSKLNPLSNPKRALIRRNWILRRMESLGYISDTDYQTAVAEPVTAVYHSYLAELNAPYIAEMARREAINLMGLSAYNDGFKVYTTVNSELQRAARAATRSGLFAYDNRHGYRGAEKHIEDPTQWSAVLKQTPVLGKLVPGIVHDVQPQSLIVMLPTGRKVQIPWENGLKGLRAFKTANTRDAPIFTANDMFRVGDLIRLKHNDKQWHLTQVPKAQAALVSLNPKNGAIKALVGGFDFKQSHFNRATQAQRQPGSNFKPFIYTVALERKFTPASIINDAPIVFEDNMLENSWRPENASGRFYGPTRLRKALYLSRNLVSIRVFRSLGINNTINGVTKFGFDRKKLPRNLSLALGSNAATPMQIATGYASFANGGFKIEPFLIDRIEDSQGTVLYQAAPPTACLEPCVPALTDNPMPETTEQSIEQVVKQTLEESNNELTEPVADNTKRETSPAPRIIEERTAYLIDSMLKDVILRGTGKRAQVLKRADIAGKTGTTNGPRDAWFSGYNPEVVTTTWLGFDENLLLGRREYGGSAALPIWIEYMKVALKDKPEVIRPQPPGMVTVRIDPKTGLRVGPEQYGIFETFLQERVPPFYQRSFDSFPTHETTSSGGSGGSDEPLPDDIF